MPVPNHAETVIFHYFKSSQRNISDIENLWNPKYISNTNVDFFVALQSRIPRHMYLVWLFSI